MSKSVVVLDYFFFCPFHFIFIFLQSLFFSHVVQVG